MKSAQCLRFSRCACRNGVPEIVRLASERVFPLCSFLALGLASNLQAMASNLQELASNLPFYNSLHSLQVLAADVG